MQAGLRTVVEENLQCAICMEKYTDPRVLPCGHTYCLECIKAHCESRNLGPGRLLQCMYCRARSRVPAQGPDGYGKNFAAASMIEAVQNIPDDEAGVREEAQNIVAPDQPRRLKDSFIRHHFFASGPLENLSNVAATMFGATLSQYALRSFLDTGAPANVSGGDSSGGFFAFEALADPKNVPAALCLLMLIISTAFEYAVYNLMDSIAVPSIPERGAPALPRWLKIVLFNTVDLISSLLVLFFAMGSLGFLLGQQNAKAPSHSHSHPRAHPQSNSMPQSNDSSLREMFRVLIGVDVGIKVALATYGWRQTRPDGGRGLDANRFVLAYIRAKWWAWRQLKHFLLAACAYIVFVGVLPGTKRPSRMSVNAPSIDIAAMTLSVATVMNSLYEMLPSKLKFFAGDCKGTFLRPWATVTLSTFFTWALVNAKSNDQKTGLL